MTVQEIRLLSEAEVIRCWTDLYRHRVLQQTPGQYLGRDSMWVEIEVSHDHYSATWNTRPVTSAAYVARAKHYAAMPGQLPPGMAAFRGSRSNKTSCDRR